MSLEFMITKVKCFFGWLFTCLTPTPLLFPDLGPGIAYYHGFETSQPNKFAEDSGRDDNLSCAHKKNLKKCNGLSRRTVCILEVQEEP